MSIHNKNGIILLDAHMKIHAFSFFLINVIWGVDFKYAIHFFRPALENPDNPEKTNFSKLSRFSGVELKQLTCKNCICFGRSKNSLLNNPVNSKNYR